MWHLSSQVHLAVGKEVAAEGREWVEVKAREEVKAGVEVEAGIEVKARVEVKIGIKVKVGPIIRGVQGHVHRSVGAFQSARLTMYLVWTIGVNTGVAVAIARPPTVSVKLYFLR